MGDAVIPWLSYWAWSLSFGKFFNNEEHFSVLQQLV